MSTANNSLRVTELDFLTIKDNLKNFLRNQDKFQDYDFEGSGLSVLLDVLAYNTHYMGYYLNMVGNEMFLDTAQMRQSVVSHAKNLNYVPSSSTGALAKVNITVTPTNTEEQNTGVLTLQKYTKFLAQDIDGVNYQFVALYSNTTPSVGNSFYFANTYLKQGEVITRQFIMDPTNTKARFEIPSANVDTTSISISVQESTTNTSTIQYNLAEDITEIASNSKVYFLEETPDSTYAVYFGDNVIGSRPKVGNVITINYLDVVGSHANSISRIFPVDPIGGKFKNNVQVTVAGTTYGGTDRETVDQIRYRAPNFYTTQNRAVTEQDYKTLILKDYKNIDSVSVWGGEDNDPVVYGKVFLSLKTKNNYYLTNVEKEYIKNDLISRRNVMSITPEIVDPDYTYMLIKGSVYYNKNLTSLGSTDLLNYVKAAIIDYRNNELNNFSSVFRKSKLQQYIENSEQSITGSDLTVYMQKRIPLLLNSKVYYNVDFGSSIQKNDFRNRIYTSPEIQSYDVNNISRNIYFEETPFADTGIYKINLVDGGINYSYAPDVTIVGDGTGATAKAIMNGNKVASILVTNSGVNYTKASVIITGGGGSGALANALLNSKLGSLRTYYVKDNGEKVIVDSNAGLVNYETGLINIYPFSSKDGTPVNRYYDTDMFTLNVPMESEIISSLRNRILTIDDNDPVAIQIDVISE